MKPPYPLPKPEGATIADDGPEEVSLRTYWLMVRERKWYALAP